MRGRRLGLLVAALVMVTCVSQVPPPSPSAPPSDALPPSTSSTQTPLAAPSAIPSAISTANAVATPSSQTLRSDLGYTIDLPAPWRRSDLLFLRKPTASKPGSVSNFIGYDLMTRRSPADERANVGGDTPGPAFNWALTIDVTKNPDRLTPLEWFTEDHVGHARGERVESAMVGGVSGIAVIAGARGSIIYVIPKGDEMMSISYGAPSGGSPLPGVPEDVVRRELDGMILSIRDIAPSGVVVFQAPAPITALPGITTYPLGPLTGEWLFTVRIRAEAPSTVRMTDVWAVELGGDRRQIVATLEESPEAPLVLRRQLSPDHRRLVVAVPTSHGDGSSGRKIVLIDLATGVADELTSGSEWDRSPAWSPDGQRISFGRGFPRFDRLWTISPTGTDLRGPFGPDQIRMSFGWTLDGKMSYAVGSPPAYEVLDPTTGERQRAMGPVALDPYGPSDERNATQISATTFAGSFTTAPDGAMWGGVSTIEVAQDVGRPQKTVAGSRPTGPTEALLQPRWAPDRAYVLFRKGYEVFVTGVFEGASALRVPMAGQVVRAEWRGGDVVSGSIVYVMRDPASGTGTTVRVAFVEDGRSRLVFRPEPLPCDPPLSLTHSSVTLTASASNVGDPVCYSDISDVIAATYR